jgi:hypothetical protein
MFRKIYATFTWACEKRTFSPAFFLDAWETFNSFTIVASIIYLLLWSGHSEYIYQFSRGSFKSEPNWTFRVHISVLLGQFQIRTGWTLCKFCTARLPVMSSAESAVIPSSWVGNDTVAIIVTWCGTYSSP